MFEQKHKSILSLPVSTALLYLLERLPLISNMINTAFIKLYQYNSPWYISTLVIQIAFLYNIRRHGREDFNSWVGKIPWSRKWQPTPVFLPKKPMDRGTWRAIVQRVAEGQTRLTDWAQAYQDEASFDKQ